MHAVGSQPEAAGSTFPKNRARPDGEAMSRALVLNATYEPLCVVPARRALLLVLQSKAELLAASGRVVRSARLVVDEPSVVRLSYFVRVPHPAHVSLNRRAVFARDGHRCQYCGEQAE